MIHKVKNPDANISIQIHNKNKQLSSVDYSIEGTLLSKPRTTDWALLANDGVYKGSGRIVTFKNSEYHLKQLRLKGSPQVEFTIEEGEK